MDFIRYRHAAGNAATGVKGHPWVAASKAMGAGNPLKKFYIFDKEAVQSKQINLDKERDAAMQIYLKVKDTPELISQMLTLLGEDVRKYTSKDKTDRMQQKLRELAESKSVLSVT
jgi:hypothetical protein